MTATKLFPSSDSRARSHRDDPRSIADLARAALGPTSFVRRVAQRARALAFAFDLGSLELDELVRFESEVDDRGNVVVVPMVFGGRFVANDVIVAVEWTIDGVKITNSPKVIRDSEGPAWARKRGDGGAETRVASLEPTAPALLGLRVHAYRGPLHELDKRFARIGHGRFEWLSQTVYECALEDLVLTF